MTQSPGSTIRRLRFIGGRRFESPRARFLVAASIGGAVALVVFAWFALEGRAGLFDPEPLAQFYEVQARSLLHGHWDVPRDAFVFERFNVDGRYYTYFGPWPALLRMPIVAFTDKLDGGLSKVFMILAFGIMLAYTARLAWHVRTVVRGDGPPTRRALLAAGGFVFVVGCGSTALFLASATWVYHEAILWGVAWSVASFSYLLEYLITPSRRALAFASATAAFALLSRGSVGLGPVAALAIVLLVRAGRRALDAWRRRQIAGSPSSSDPWWQRVLGVDVPSTSRVWPLALATAVPIGIYAYVNVVKFGTLLGTPPYHLQDLLATRPTRQAALAANDGSLFGVGYAPTLLLEYLRPDAIGFDRFFPWVTFASPPQIVGDAVFEAVNFSASLPTTSTLLVVLSIVGAIAAVCAPRPEGSGPSAAVLRVPLLGALVGCAGMFVLAFLEQRYQGDFVPLLALAGAAGLWYTARWLEGRTAAVRRVAVGAIVVLAAWSCWAVFSLTLLQQREYGPLVTRGERASFLDVQLDVHDAVPGGAVSRVVHGTLPLPRPPRAGTLLVIGDCRGLYWSDGRFWHPVEQTPRTGGFRLDLVVEPAPQDTFEPILAATDDRGSSVLWLRHLGENRVRFEYEWTGKSPSIIEGVTVEEVVIGERFGEAVRVPASGALEISTRLDPAGYVSVRRGEHLVLSTIAPVAAVPATVGAQDVSMTGATAFAGTITSRPIATRLCDRFTRLEREG